MKKHYYFYKKNDDNYENVVIVDNPYDLNKLNLDIDDFYYLNDVQNFKNLLSNHRVLDFDQYNFNTGFYRVFKIENNNFGSEFEMIFLKEIDKIILKKNKVLEKGEKILMQDTPYEILERIKDEVAESYKLKNIFTDDIHTSHLVTLLNNNAEIIL